MKKQRGSSRKLIRIPFLRTWAIESSFGHSLFSLQRILTLFRVVVLFRMLLIYGSIT